jgi:hypothetical protein
MTRDASCLSEFLDLLLKNFISRIGIIRLQHIVYKVYSLFFYLPFRFSGFNSLFCNTEVNDSIREYRIFEQTGFNLGGHSTEN